MIKGGSVLLLLSLFFAYLLAPAVDVVSRCVRIGTRAAGRCRGAPSLTLIYVLLSMPVGLAWRFAREPIAQLGPCHRAGQRSIICSAAATSKRSTGSSRRRRCLHRRARAEAPHRGGDRLHPAPGAHHPRHADRRGALCVRGSRVDPGARGDPPHRLAELSPLDAARPAARPPAVARRGVSARRQQRAGRLYPRAGRGRRDRRRDVRDGFVLLGRAIGGVAGRRRRHPRAGAGYRTGDDDADCGDAGGRSARWR